MSENNLVYYIDKAKEEAEKKFAGDAKEIKEFIEANLIEVASATVKAAGVVYDIENKHEHPKWDEGWESAMKWVDGHFEKFLKNLPAVPRRYFY